RVAGFGHAEDGTRPGPRREGRVVDSDDAVELPSGFRLGVSTSAYQTEGAAGDRGESIWDGFLARSRLPVAAWSVATDHLRRLEEDLRSEERRVGEEGRSRWTQ